MTCLHSQRLGDDMGGLMGWLVGRPAQRVKVRLPYKSYGNSVCSSVTCWYCIQTNEDSIMWSSLCGSPNTSFLTPTGDVVPSHLKFAVKVTHHPFEKQQLWPISTYNISTVKVSKKIQLSWIRSLTHAFQQAIDKVTLTPLKGGSKSEFVIFMNKNQFKSYKLCYKVSLCDNFQW